MRMIITLLAAAGLSGASLAEDVSDTWNLGDIYPSVEAWAEAKDALESSLSDVDQCQGRLGDSAQKLLECSEMLSDMYKTFARLASYASMASDADTRDAENQKRRTEIQILGSKFCIQGNVPSSLIVTGTPADVKERCRKLIEDCGEGGGYILGPGCIPDKPKLENVRAMMAAAKEYGIYKK